MMTCVVEFRLHPQRAADEAGFGKKLRDRMRRWRDAVDLLDEHAAWRLAAVRARSISTRATARAVFDRSGSDSGR
jgi:hypothetical protein